MKEDMLFTPIKKKNKSVTIAKRLLDSVCSTMKTRAYAFIPVLNMLKFVAVKEDIEICTDGEIIYYNAKNIIHAAKYNQLEIIEETLFHILFHGMLGHFEAGDWTNKKLSWAVWDIQVNRCMRMIYKKKELFHGCSEEWSENYIGDELYFKAQKDKEFRKKVKHTGELCRYEDHSTWNPYKIKVYLSEEGNNGEGTFWKEARKLLFGTETITNLNAEQMCKELLKDPAISRKYGSESADMKNEVEYVDTSTTSYRELIEKITKLSEVVYEEQEIDKVLYQYGLELYGDVPLVEPEEMSEKHCLHTLVVAVDTSGSCTWRAELFFKELVAVFEEIKKVGRVNHICYLECDTEIKNQKDYYSIEEFVGFGKKHIFTGGGGTDFMPVFEHAEHLTAEGEQIDALIYISDGYGDFPEYDEAPPYATYFLLDVEDELEVEYLKDNWLPGWVDYLVLDKEKRQNRRNG